ncbi:MAG: Crp/Fnr family transcriptional regulator [Actinomycetales bacterium]|nr:Crp/Fnr family transcriptional regulator [Actinomycetales bacterium]
MDDVLMSAPLFAALDVEAAAALKTSMDERRLLKGDILFSEGDPGDRLYVVTEGKIKLGHASGDGRESLLAVMGEGEMFGELSLFDPGPRTATATALTDATVLGLGHAALRPWLTGRPEVAESLLQALAQRLRRTNDTLADLVFSDVPGRVAKALLDLGERFGQSRPDGLHVTHDMTQEELAQLVGASRETVNKALADFASRGWLRLESRSVVLLDVERLQRRAR